MALIKTLSEKPRERYALHQPINATYSIFESDGKVILQIDSYGRDTRENPGKQSQTLQIDREGAVQLMGILRRAFDL